MGKYDVLRDAGAPLMLGGGFLGAGALMVELFGYEQSQGVPEALRWVEYGGGIIFAVGAAALVAYKLLNPGWPPEDDRDHWRNGY